MRPQIHEYLEPLGGSQLYIQLGLKSSKDLSIEKITKKLAIFSY